MQIKGNKKTTMII